MCVEVFRSGRTCVNPGYWALCSLLLTVSAQAFGVNEVVLLVNSSTAECVLSGSARSSAFTLNLNNMIQKTTTTRPTNKTNSLVLKHKGDITNLSCASVNDSSMSVIYQEPNSKTDVNVTHLQAMLILCRGNRDTVNCNSTRLCNKYGCGCAPGFNGRMCANKCTTGFYGYGCKETCGHCLANRDCNAETGYCCTGCQENYTMPYCKLLQGPEPAGHTKNYPWNEMGISAAVTAGVILLLLGIVLLIVNCSRRGKMRVTSENAFPLAENPHPISVSAPLHKFSSPSNSTRFLPPEHSPPPVPWTMPILKPIAPSMKSTQDSKVVPWMKSTTNPKVMPLIKSTPDPKVMQLMKSTPDPKVMPLMKSTPNPKVMQLMKSTPDPKVMPLKSKFTPGMKSTASSFSSVAQSASSSYKQNEYESTSKIPWNRPQLPIPKAELKEEGSEQAQAEYMDFMDEPGENRASVEYMNYDDTSDDAEYLNMIPGEDTAESRPEEVAPEDDIYENFSFHSLQNGRH